LSRQSRRSPNRLYCYTASRSPLPSLPFVSRYRSAALFRVSSPYSRHIRTRSIPRPSAARLHPTAWPDFQQIRIDHTSAILRAARSVFRTFPSRPIDPGSRDLQVGIFRRLQRPWTRIGFPSIPIRSVLHAIVPPLRSISRSRAVTPSRTRHRVQATSPQRVPPACQLLYLARSLHRPTIAPLARSLSFGSAHS
jgi:hypothetical protein